MHSLVAPHDETGEFVLRVGDRELTVHYDHEDASNRETYVSG